MRIWDFATDEGFLSLASEHDFSFTEGFGEGTPQSPERGRVEDKHSVSLGGYPSHGKNGPRQSLPLLVTNVGPNRFKVWMQGA